MTDSPPDPYTGMLAVLRPKPGDVVILYADLYKIPDVELIVRLMRDLRSRDIVAGMLPDSSALTLLPGESDLVPKLDQWLRPFGFHAVRLGR